MPELPEMKVLNIADKSFKVVDAAAQDHLLTHDQQIQQILDNDVVNENMLINSDFIANFNDPNDDLNLSGWKITASSQNKPVVISSMGLMIQPNMTDVKIYTPSWHAQWLSSGNLDLLGFPITLSVEYRIGSLGDIRTASVTFNSSANSDVNIAEIEEGKYLKVKMFGSDSQSDGTQSCFYMSDTLSTNLVCIRRVKIERSEIATGFPQSMKDLALLKVVKEMVAEAIDAVNGKFNNYARRYVTTWGTTCQTSEGRVQFLVLTNRVLYVVWLASTNDINVANVASNTYQSGTGNVTVDNIVFTRLSDSNLKVQLSGSGTITIFG